MVVLSRNVGAPGVLWDGRTLGAWAEEIDGADVVINLAGRSVDCRYGAEAPRGDPPLARRLHARHRRGDRPRRSIRRGSGCRRAPPRSTPTATTRRTTSARGILGGNEPDVPDEWRFSIDVAQAWEKALDDAPTPRTRKVKLRTAMVMSADRGGAFHALLRHVRLGFGRFGDGRQYMSWIHERDFVARRRLADRRTTVDGAVNLAAPDPLPNAEFMRDPARGVGSARLASRRAAGARDRRAGSLRTEPELVLKSRRVVPGRLLEEGFSFDFPRRGTTRRAISARSMGGAAAKSGSLVRTRVRSHCVRDPMAQTAKAEETRNRILDAALRLFRERGFAQTTMRDVATEAGVATGAAYYYFRSKEELVHGLLPPHRGGGAREVFAGPSRRRRT